ncbi:hypothetical protein KLP40_20845 [Hymenobacter sp. NST-14]|uniref:hypothetical protein n=1 Tax=Hymenobacter piscis TaxID=2839984 RepID=UPI001C01C30B|nr:hypothetical protein [Hymenobacter piscis]MBT9395626.1 hypothetical protein [Hymenobacter piscis]
MRPAISVLDLLVSQALLQTDAATYQRLALLLTPAVEAQLDALLAPDPALRVKPHRWLCQPATANTPAAINQALLAMGAETSRILRVAVAARRCPGQVTPARNV